MILDKLLNFEPTTGTAVTVTADSTDTIDFGAARDMGIGDDPAILLWVNSIAAFAAAGAATLTILVRMSADNVTYYTVAQSNALPVANLTANTRLFSMYLPQRPLELGDAKPRYLKLNYTVATGPMTAGSLFAGLTLDGQLNTGYPPGITVAN